MVICHGCGQLVELPEGYSRNKIQCPGCGVICPVPAGTESTPRKARAAEPAARPRSGWEEQPPAAAAKPPTPAPVREDEASSWLMESSPAPTAEPSPRSEEPPLRFAEATPAAEEPVAAVPVAKKPKEILFPCRRCGRLVRRQRECPNCDGVPEDPGGEGAGASAPVGMAPHSLELDEPESPSAAGDDDDDPSPYFLADKELPTCPKCHKDMVPGAVLCTSCGFNLRTRKKAKKTYEPIARRWETDQTLSQRLMWLGAAQGLHVFLALLSSVVFDVGFWPFVVTWPVMTAMFSFVLGTYDTIELTRDTRGRAKITIVWRFFFVPTLPKETELRGFEGIVTGQWLDAGFWEWFICVSLLPLGVIPSIIYWYMAIYKPFFHVALAQDHGHAAVYVFRGHSVAQMNEIADAICGATGWKNVS
jgi:hypothetical protein